MNSAFKALVESINSQIAILKNNGFRIVDSENEGYYISGIRYDSKDDEIKFDTTDK